MADQGEIERAIRAVAGGEVIFSGAVAGRVLHRLTADLPVPTVLRSLSDREREVLDLMATGVPNATVAQRLGVAPKTVGNHITSIFGKLGIATRAEAIVIAKDAGLGRRG